MVTNAIEQAKRWVRNYVRKIMYFIGGGIVLFFFICKYFGIPFPPEIAISISIGLSYFMLTEIYATVIKSDQTILEQRHAYRKLQDNIPKSRDKSAVLIQFSSQTSLPLVHALLEEDYTVTLHLQHPGAARRNVSEYQANRIALTLADLSSTLTQEQRAKLKIYFYDTPASMNGVKIGTEKLIVGWYTHKRNINTEDTVNGHDVPSLALSKSDPGYELLVKEFEKLAGHYSNSQPWTLDTLGLQSAQHVTVDYLIQQTSRVSSATNP